MARPARGWMPINACREIVGSPSLGIVFRLIIIHHLDDEQLLAVLPVTWHEQLVALEAFFVLVTQSYLRWGEADGARRGFVDRA
jgi:hypothetical protein